MVDPDVPTPQNPIVSQIRHFLGGNFFVEERYGHLVNVTPAITEFTGPHPANISDPHRWVPFFVSLYCHTYCIVADTYSCCTDNLQDSTSRKR